MTRKLVSIFLRLMIRVGCSRIMLLRTTSTFLISRAASSNGRGRSVASGFCRRIEATELAPSRLRDPVNRLESCRNTSTRLGRLRGPKRAVFTAVPKSATLAGLWPNRRTSWADCLRLMLAEIQVRATQG